MSNHLGSQKPEAKNKMENSDCVIHDISDAYDSKEIEVDSIVQKNLEHKIPHSMKGVKGSRKTYDVFEPVVRGQRKYWVFINLELPRSEGDQFVYEPESQNRSQFILYTFGLLSGMLLFTVGVTIASLATGLIKALNLSRTVFIVIAAVCSISLMLISYAFACIPCARRGVVGVLLCILTTLLYTVVSAIVTSRFKTTILLSAAGSTLLITLVCLALACTSFDFTRYLLYVIAAMCGIAVASLILFVLQMAGGPKLTGLRIGLTILSAIAGAVMMIIEFQMILGGKTEELAEDEAPWGAYLLYTSIIQMFFKLLTIFRYFSDDD